MQTECEDVIIKGMFGSEPHFTLVFDQVGKFLVGQLTLARFFELNMLER
jgi:hypothetical protein